MKRSEIYSQKEKAPHRCFFILVEHRGLEPLTPTLPVWCAPNCANAPNGGDGENRTRVQNHLIKGSTSVVCLLSYPLSWRRQTAFSLRYSLIPDESRDTLSFMFATKSTLCIQSWQSVRERKLLIKQQEQLNYFCQFILSCYFLSGATPLLADQDSTTLSKAFHPHIQLMIIFFKCPFNLPVGILFCLDCTFIVKLFTFTKSNLKLCSAL